jgi:hypothetical protein
MQLTYEHPKWTQIEPDDLSPDDTRNIPFFGFATATLLSLGLWSYIAWTVWAVIR